MNTDIEYFDQKRMVWLKWYLIGFIICLTLMLTRHFFRLSGLNSQPIGTAVLIGAIITLLIQIISVIKAALLEREINGQPHLKAALNNELVKSLTTESWVAAYIGACGMTLFFAISSSFYPICDPVTISLTSIVTGAGASRVYFYIKYKTL
jgi:hypothetical protein